MTLENLENYESCKYFLWLIFFVYKKHQRYLRGYKVRKRSRPSPFDRMCTRHWQSLIYGLTDFNSYEIDKALH